MTWIGRTIKHGDVMKSLWNRRGAAKIWLRSLLLLILGLSLYELAYGCFAYWVMAHLSPPNSLRSTAPAVQDEESVASLRNVVEFIGIHLAR